MFPVLHLVTKRSAHFRVYSAGPVCRLRQYGQSSAAWHQTSKVSFLWISILLRGQARALFRTLYVYWPLEKGTVVFVGGPIICWIVCIERAELCQTFYVVEFSSAMISDGMMGAKRWMVSQQSESLLLQAVSTKSTSVALVRCKSIIVWGQPLYNSPTRRWNFST